MPVFRYDTNDIVRCLPNEALTCDRAGIPATSKILGKRNTLLHTSNRVVTSKDLVEAYEALPSHPWPARFSAHVVGDHIEMVVSEQLLKDMTKEDIERHFQQAGIDLLVACCAINEQSASQLRPLRADLVETTFITRRD